MPSLKTIPLLLAIAVVATSAAPLGDTPPRSAAAMPAVTAFQHAVDQFIEAELKLYPERATALGDHRFDARVDDDSATGIAQIVSHAKKWAKIFHAFDANSLSPHDEADREWLLANIDAELLWTEGMRSYERDPGRYLPTAAVHKLITRNFAPARVRMRSVTAREKAGLANLRAARANLRPERVSSALDATLKAMEMARAVPLRNSSTVSRVCGWRKLCSLLTTRSLVHASR